MTKSDSKLKRITLSKWMVKKLEEIKTAIKKLYKCVNNKWNLLLKLRKY